VPYPDTAKAAEDLANGTVPDTTAVIAPRKCAELYGLEVLEESIQDLKYNFTTFVVARKTDS
jgi:prephenate dehydratase